MSGIEITAHTENETQKLAAALAAQCRMGDCILLKGDLGAGKTTFARGFIRALTHSSEEVVSPTFMLVQTYPGLWHFDLYRLKHESELQEIGLDEALSQGITLIEWPEIALSRLPADALAVTIHMEQTGARRIHLQNTAWESRLSCIKESYV